MTMSQLEDYVKPSRHWKRISGGYHDFSGIGDGIFSGIFEPTIEEIRSIRWIIFFGTAFLLWKWEFSWHKIWLGGRGSSENVRGTAYDGVRYRDILTWWDIRIYDYTGMMHCIQITWNSLRIVWSRSVFRSRSTWTDSVRVIIIRTKVCETWCGKRKWIYCRCRRTQSGWVSWSRFL